MAQPTHLHTSEYLSAHLKTLQTILAQTSKAAHILPRHLRRRAASHNSAKLPRRLRIPKQQLEKEGEAGIGAAKKKQTLAKKPKRIHKTQIRRERKFKTKKWIPTHIWHAKRFKMEKVWDHIPIPIHPCDKSKKAIYNAGKYQCWINDQSYMQVYKLSSTSEGEMEETMSGVDAVSENHVLSWLKSVCGGAAAIYQRGKEIKQFIYNDMPICPVTLYWVDTFTCLLSYHPAANSEMHKVLHDTPKFVKAEILKTGRISTFGTRAHAILQHILKPIDGLAKDWWTPLADLTSPASLKRSIAVPMTISDPRQNFPPPSMPARTHNVATENLAQACQGHIPVELALSLDWMPREGQVHTQYPILLVNNLHGWDIFLPEDRVLDLWHSLVYAGARVGGLRELQREEWSKGLPSFPFDYPGIGRWSDHKKTIPTPKISSQFVTALHGAHARQSCKEGEDEYATWQRKPKGKRTAIFEQWTDFDALFGVGYYLGKRGLDLASSCKIYQVTLKSTEKGIPLVHAKVMINDRIVGAITSGGYSFENGCGAAIGVVKAESFETASKAELHPNICKKSHVKDGIACTWQNQSDSAVRNGIIKLVISEHH